MAQIPFSDYLSAHRALKNEFSANLLVTLPEFDADGKPIPLGPAPPLRFTPTEVLRLIQPYVSIRFMDQLKAVVPLALYLALFQLLILKQVVEDSMLITGGLFAVIIGLMIFMEGLARGLMPLGEIIGSTLPRKSPLPLVLFITLLLGIGVTFAEPAIGALQAAGQNISVERAPYLYALLNDWADTLVLVVGASVGMAAVIGTVRFLYGWSLKPLIYLTLAPVLALTIYCATDPQLTNTLGLAWDAGAVTTGPVTVPLVLSLGIGIAAAAGKSESGLSGFGIVTLASLFPILGVMLLAIYVATTVTPAEIIEGARQAATAAHDVQLAWYERSPGAEIVGGIRAILPLVIFLFLVLKLVLRERSEGFVSRRVGAACPGRESPHRRTAYLPIDGDARPIEPRSAGARSSRRRPGGASRGTRSEAFRLSRARSRRRASRGGPRIVGTSRLPGRPEHGGARVRRQDGIPLDSR